jgi:hypothetical protein
MKQTSDFLREYFLQTRREIDAEKESRDRLLNFIILAIGAVGFTMFQSEKADTLLAHPCALIIELSILVTITALFWLRRKKLQQIADRWFVLGNLLSRHFDEIAIEESLEAIVE